jgi:hypothetical protein
VPVLERVFLGASDDVLELVRMLFKTFLILIEAQSLAWTPSSFISPPHLTPHPQILAHYDEQQGMLYLALVAPDDAASFGRNVNHVQNMSPEVCGFQVSLCGLLHFSPMSILTPPPLSTITSQQHAGYLHHMEEVRYRALLYCFTVAHFVVVTQPSSTYDPRFTHTLRVLDRLRLRMQEAGKSERGEGRAA